MSNTNNKTFILKLAFILFAITFISTLLLTLCNHVTKDRISELEAKAADEAKQSVIADATFEEVIIEDTLKKQLEKDYAFVAMYKAEKNGEFAGYCVNVNPNGFGGPINMFVGIDTNNAFTGVKIISMSETPGLGSKAQDKAFSEQFYNGKSGKLERVKNNSNPGESQINAISGATITSDAVITGANNALDIAEIIKKEVE